MRHIVSALAIIFTVLSLAGCGSSGNTNSSSGAGYLGKQSGLVNLDAINTSEDDFAPYILPDGSQLVFTSDRKSSSVELIDNKSRFGEALYISSGSGVLWSPPSPMFPASPMRLNQGTIAIDASGEELFIGAAYAQPSTGGSDIFRVRKAIGQWSSPELMSELSSKWWDSQPGLSPDGSRLVFASDRSDTDPNSDIQGTRLPELYESRKLSNGTWSVPDKMPYPVNSDSGEMSPFFCRDGYLYFATKRFDPSNFDLARVRIMQNGWGSVERLPEPVNSPYNDVFPFVTQDRSMMYFASDRPGGKGRLDIYASPFPARIRLKGGIVQVDKDRAGGPARGVHVTIRNEADGSTQDIVTDADGNYTAQILPNAHYRIVPTNAECYGTADAEDLITGMPFSLDTTIVRDFRMERNVFPSFQLGHYNIPFFVTGYYYPNTARNLGRLRRRVDEGELMLQSGGNTPYISLDDEDYASYSSRIESIFDTVYTTIENTILPTFTSCALPTEVLKIEVLGFVDPRGLTPGIYPDETVQTETMRIEKGSAMARQEGNDKLANLRAYYTLQMIDQDLVRRSEKYRELKNAGRIQLTAIGVGIDVETKSTRAQEPAKRRIDIRLSITAPGKK